MFGCLILSSDIVSIFLSLEEKDYKKYIHMLYTVKSGQWDEWLFYPCNFLQKV